MKMRRKHKKNDDDNDDGDYDDDDDDGDDDGDGLAMVMIPGYSKGPLHFQCQHASEAHCQLVFVVGSSISVGHFHFLLVTSHLCG